MKVHRYLKRTILVVLVLCLLIVLGIAALPSLVGSRRMQSALRERVNEGLTETQHVSWERVRLGWFGRQRIENLVYQDDGISVSVDSISIEKGLASLIGRNIAFGMLEVERPQIRITLPEVPPHDPDPVVPDVRPYRPRERERREYPPTDEKLPDVVVAEHVPFRLPVNFRGNMQVQNGSLTVRNAAGTKESVWQDMDMHVSLADGLREAIDMQLTAKQPHEAGIGEVALSTSLHLLQADGSFDVESFLADMSLALENIHIGSFAWIPHELADAPMLEGKLHTKLEASIFGVDQLSIDYQTQIHDALVYGGALGEDRLELGNIETEAKVLWRDQALRVDAMRVDNVLLQLQGEGALEAFGRATYPVGNMRLDMKADIARTLMQLPNTVPLHEGIELDAGMLLLDALLESDGENLAFSGNMTLPHVQMRRDALELDIEELLQSQFAIKLSEAGPVVDELKLQTPFAEIEGSGDLDSMRIRGDLDLDAAREMAAQFVDMGSQIMEGRITIAGHLETRAADTRSFEVTTELPGIRYGVSEDQVFALDAVHIDTRGNIHFETDTFDPLRVSELRLIFRSEPAQFSATVPEMDLQTVLPAFPVASLQWDLDLAKLEATLSSAGIWQDDIRMEGIFKGATSVSLQKDILAVSPFEGNLTNLRFKADEMEWDEPAVTIRWAGKLHLPPAALDAMITNGVVESAALSLQLPEARFFIPEDALPVVEVRDAVLKSDLGALAPLIQATTGAPIELDGESRTSISWRSPISPVWEEMVREGQGTGEIRVPRVKAYGMLATNVVTTMQAEGGLVHLALDTAVNEGRVVMDPVLDVTGEEAFLIIPDDSHVIQNVVLTDEMATELLGLVHPLLRGSTVLGGIVNLTLETCRIPLSETGVKGADLRGSFLLRDLELEARDALARVMETARLRSQRVKVDEQRIAFYVQEGRIHPTPLEFSVSGYALSLAGSVGLDSSLDYKVAVPVSSELVGREAYRLLDGQTLALPIRGTVTRPEIARDAFARAVGEMAKEAATDAVRKEGREAVRDLQERGEDALRDFLRRNR